MLKIPLSLETRIAEKADFEVLINYQDMTQATVNTAQAFTFPVAAKMSVELVRSILDVPFEDTADAAFNDVQVSVGDAGSATRYLTATQVNVNGTEVLLKAGTGTIFPYLVTDAVIISFASMAAKALASLKKGQMRFQFRINDERPITAAP